MRILILAAGPLLLANASAAAPARQETGLTAPARAVSPYPSNCPRDLTQWIRRDGEPLKPRKLAELPPAEAYHTVLRAGPDGCPDPLLVRDQHRQKR